MNDQFERTLKYLRISITDRCNLRCQYCIPEDIPFMPHDEILTYDEIIRVSASMAKLGVDTLRITGGEPLLRSDCTELIGRLKAIEGIKKVKLTTNGVYLLENIEKLSEYKIDGINVSLDTRDAKVFKDITGFDRLGKVMDGIHKALEHNIQVKINVVPLKDVNENELVSLANLAKELPVDVKFIELMPTEICGNLEGITSDEVLEILKKEYQDIKAIHEFKGLGPAKYYKTDDMLGSVGFINPISHGFCGDCNRLRLTSDGYLKLCLYHKEGSNLRDLIRGGCTDQDIIDTITEAVSRKPEKHFFDEKPGFKSMSQIGG